MQAGSANGFPRKPKDAMEIGLGTLGSSIGIRQAKAIYKNWRSEAVSQSSLPELKGLAKEDGRDTQYQIQQGQAMNHD